MAGNSERFTNAGYVVPKQYMLIDDRPMIHWVCDMFSPEDDFVFVIPKAHGANTEFRNILETAVPKYTIIEIHPHRLGPAYTALAADSVVEDEEPVILTYCDFYQHWNYRQFRWKVEGWDGGIAVFKGFHPASFGDTYYAYLRCNERGEMLELREKRSFTGQRHEEPASTGVYYVRSWAIFRRFAWKVMDLNLSLGGEYYISLIFNPMVEEGHKVVTFEVDKFICWGTPEDVEQYCFWSDFFRNDAARILNRVVSEP